MDRKAAQAMIENTFNYPFDEDRFRYFAINLLTNLDKEKDSPYISGKYIKDFFREHVHKYRRIGTFVAPDGDKLDVLVVHLVNPWALERSRTMLRNFTAWYLKNQDEKDAALVAYHTDDLDDWRFSFVRMEYRQEITEKGTIKVKEEFTPARRYSYLVGKNEPNHTAQEQMIPILEDDQDNPTLAEIEAAFSVDAVTKQFYKDYRALFEKLTNELNNILEKDNKIKKEFEDKSIDTANFSKKLMGQIVFLYFLQKKGWLGVSKDNQGNFKRWGTGPKNFMKRLFNREFSDYKNFFNDILEPLFYNALNNGDRRSDYYEKLDCKIPFLNGGLFESMNDYDWVETEIRIDNDIFKDILDTFDRYNFTVREDEPLDKEVAVDPEMLGKVFENLLPENLRKGKGSYYTPRTIVHYMCQESLINYLASECEKIIPKEDIELLIHKGESARDYEEQRIEKTMSKEDHRLCYKRAKIPDSIKQNAQLIDEKLAEIKVCDPAIGSGAFPVGMMNEIVKARLVLDTYLKTGKSLYDFKRHCIQNSLYGVDIDPGAIDIAKLRLWLSLVVDEEDYHTIQPLPNLEYKIMQGNSLIEEFRGISLDLEKKKHGEDRLFTMNDKLDSLIAALHEKQNIYLNEPHPEAKKKLKIEVDEAIVDIFHYELQRQKKDYFKEWSRIKSIAETIQGNIRDQYLKEEKVKLSKRFRYFDFEVIEKELLEMTRGNKSRNFFPWKLYFADVFHKKSGFDMVIANPPYILLQNIDIDDKQLKYIKEHFYSAQYKIDTYHLFIELGLSILRTNGAFAYITPNTFLKNKHTNRLREYLVKNSLINSIINFFVRVFEDPSVDNLIITSIKKSSAKSPEHRIKIYDIRSTNFIKELESVRYFLQKSIEPDDFIFEVDISEEMAQIIEKIKNKSLKLGTIAKTYFGIQTYDRTRFVCYKKQGDSFKPVIDGANVLRYYIIPHKEFVDFKPKNIKSGGNPKVYEKDRIVVRQIGRYPEGGLCEKGIYTLNTIYNIFLKKNNFDLTFILSILNSKCTQFYWLSRFYDKKATFPKIKKIPLESILIPKLNVNETNTFIDIAKRIIAKKKDNPNIDTSKLEAEIDHMLYELYELTDKEIAIVQESEGK